VLVTVAGLFSDFGLQPSSESRLQRIGSEKLGGKERFTVSSRCMIGLGDAFVTKLDEDVRSTLEPQSSQRDALFSKDARVGDLARDAGRAIEATLEKRFVLAERRTG